MKKIVIEIPETQKEAISHLVKNAVSCDDIDLWMVRSKKDYIKNKLAFYQTLASDAGMTLTYVHDASVEEICLQVEKQVLDLILGFEENH